MKSKILEIFRRRNPSSSRLVENGSRNNGPVEVSTASTSSQSFESSISRDCDSDTGIESSVSANSSCAKVQDKVSNGGETDTSVSMEVEKLTKLLAQRDQELKSLTEEKYRIQSSHGKEVLAFKVQICQLEKALQVSKREYESHLAREKETKENRHVSSTSMDSDRIPKPTETMICTSQGVMNEHNSIPLISRDGNVMMSSNGNNGYVKVNAPMKSRSIFYVNEQQNRISELEEKLSKMKERSHYTEQELAEVMKKYALSQKDNASLSEEIDQLTEEKLAIVDSLNRLVDGLERYRSSKASFLEEEDLCEKNRLPDVAQHSSSIQAFLQVTDKDPELVCKLAHLFMSQQNELCAQLKRKEDEKVVEDLQLEKGLTKQHEELSNCEELRSRLQRIENEFQQERNEWHELQKDFLVAMEAAERTKNEALELVDKILGVGQPTCSLIKEEIDFDR